MNTEPITVPEADRLLARHPLQTDVVEVPLHEAANRILREPLLADRDLPPFDRVTMDGIALPLEAWNSGQRVFPIEGVQAAGAPARPLRNPVACVKVMTGAILPIGTDCVIPIEQVALHDATARVHPDTPAAHMQFVHRQGIDARRGQTLLQPGRRLTSPDILIAASVGAHHLRVTQPPLPAIVSNGDELVPIDQAPAPHQIRASNAHALQTALREMGIAEATLRHFPDDRQAMENGVRELLAHHRLLIFSGGVSAGDYDYMPDVLSALDVRAVFHKIRQRPGKPFWFGTGPEGQVVFALPGNPVSTLISFHRHIKPWLLRNMGATPAPRPLARLAADLDFTPPLTHFRQVRLTGFEEGTPLVEPAGHHGSGDYVSLAGTDGFIELPPDRDHFPVGFLAPFHAWR